MSYTPTEWKSGDVVTSAKLNKLENAMAASFSGVDPTSAEDLVSIGVYKIFQYEDEATGSVPESVFEPNEDVIVTVEGYPAYGNTVVSIVETGKTPCLDVCIYGEPGVCTAEFHLFTDGGNVNSFMFVPNMAQIMSRLGSVNLSSGTNATLSVQYPMGQVGNEPGVKVALVGVTFTGTYTIQEDSN